MGGANAFAFAMTISGRDHVTGTMTQEVVAFLKSFCLWYGLKHETRTDGTVHIHAALVFEKSDKHSSRTMGAQRPDNLKRRIKEALPTVKELVAENGPHALQVITMTSDVFVVSYMQKEKEMDYLNLPKDTTELIPYFAELHKKKNVNSNYTKWKTLYAEQKREMPATFDSTVVALQQWMNNDDTKAIANHRDLAFAASRLMHSLNGTVAEIKDPEETRKRKLEEKKDRLCPYCPTDAQFPEYAPLPFGPNILGKFQKKCDSCKSKN